MSTPEKSFRVFSFPVFPMAFFKAGSQKTITAAISLSSVGFLMSGLEAVTGTVLSLAYIHIYIYTPLLLFLLAWLDCYMVLYGCSFFPFISLLGHVWSPFCSPRASVDLYTLLLFIFLLILSLEFLITDFFLTYNLTLFPTPTRCSIFRCLQWTVGQ